MNHCVFIAYKITSFFLSFPRYSFPDLRIREYLFSGIRQLWKTFRVQYQLCDWKLVSIFQHWENIGELSLSQNRENLLQLTNFNFTKFCKAMLNLEKFCQSSVILNLSEVNQVDADHELFPIPKRNLCSKLYKEINFKVT